MFACVMAFIGGVVVGTVMALVMVALTSANHYEDMGDYHDPDKHN